MDSESFHLVLAKERTSRCKCVPARYVLTFLIFWGLFVVFLLRANLSVALVAMVNNTAIASTERNQSHHPICLSIIENYTTANSSGDEKYKFEKDGEMMWDITIQSVILGSFYYGYAATQLPGGWIAERFGGKWPFGLGIMLTSIFTLLTPFAARLSVIFIVLIRIFKGLGEGITYPAMYALFSRWAPLKERSLLIAIASVGANLGTILGMPATALFCEHGFDGGWPSAFYICGIFGCIWFIPWSMMVASRPTRHSGITDTELVHLKLHLGPLKKRPPTPWKSILCSRAVWAVTVARFAGYWGLFTLITELPNYLRNVMGFNMDGNGAVNAIIYFSQSIGMIAGGYISDLLRIKYLMSINVNRKIFESIGCFGPAICLFLATYGECNRIFVVSLLTLGQGLYGFNAGGSIPAMVDLAPDLAGTVSGLVLTIANVAGVLAPSIAGLITKRERGFEDWNLVFMITSGVYVVGGLVFLIFGSAEIQPWGHTVDVPTETSTTVRAIAVATSASFSGPSKPAPTRSKQRTRFSTLGIMPVEKPFSEDESSFEDSGRNSPSY